ncbi:MAG TPA: hypothetical protein VIM98_16455 [Dyella sp.]|uniref:hypothetical protein n=1 Tax=Dyella sp. TaxID=1869338 RepID=UPI002F92810F
MPKGLISIEPYLIYSNSSYFYDDHGNKRRRDTRTSQWQTLVPITIGVTERIGLQALLGAVHNHAGSQRSSGLRATDASARAQFLLVRPSADGLTPAVSVGAIHFFPTGRYDRLGNNVLNGSGSGLHSDRVDLLIQQSIPMPNGRPLRWRGRVAYDFNPGAVDVRGQSVYGTEPGFRGSVSPHHAWNASASAEYSIDAHWVLVMELAYQRSAAARVSGQAPGNGSTVAIDRYMPPGHTFSVAPAVEYNVNGSLGIIAGVHASLSGRNSGAFVAPQVAVNIVF